MTPDDLALFEQWRSGDARAGSLLVKRHFSALHRFFSAKTRGPAEDLVQQTFLACAEAAEAYRGEASFRAYLFGIARLQLLMHYRQSHGERRLDFTTTALRDLRKTPSGMLAQHQDEHLLRLALQSVPLEQQIALELCYWEGLSASEIAHALQISENTVYSRLHRARRQLRLVFERLSADPEEKARALALLRSEQSAPG